MFFLFSLLELGIILTMSGFFSSNDATSRWGGYFKQAISNVETTFDSLLEQPPIQQQQQSTTNNKGNHYSF